MVYSINIAVLPVGEFDDNLTRREAESILRVFNNLGATLSIVDAVVTEEEACRSVQKLLDLNPDLLLIIPMRGLSAQVMEAAGRTIRIPCLVWPVQGNFALPSSALAVGALREVGLPAELFYAPPGYPDSLEPLRSIINAMAAYSRLRRSRVGVIGGLFPNLVSCRYDPQIVESRLGMTLFAIPFEDIRDIMRRLPILDVERARVELATPYSVVAEDAYALDAGVRLHLALKQIALEKKLDGFTTECWSGFPRELGLNPCLGFIEDAYTLACEGDVMLCSSLLIVKYLTGVSAYSGDVYDLDLSGVLTLVHCGAPASLASNNREVMLAKSPFAMERGFETITCRPLIAAGPVTLVRFYGQDCDKMHIATSELLSSKQATNLMVKVKLDGNRWDFLGQFSGNHYVVAPGNIREGLRLLCKWLGITLNET